MAHLPLKFHPEQTLSLQYGDVEATPLLLHVNGVVSWRHLDMACLDCTLTRQNTTIVNLHIYFISLR